MKVAITFTKDFATQKKGDEIKIDGMIASKLINSLRVAKLKTNKKQVVKK